MNDKTIESIQLFFKVEPSDKVYNATLLETSKGYTVSVEWGRRGKQLSTATKIVDATLEKAQKAYDKVVKQKMDKGYQAVTTNSQSSKESSGKSDNSEAKTRFTVRERVGVVAQLLNYAEKEQLEQLFTDSNILAQQKFDGMRMIIHVRETDVCATNREGQETSLPKAIGQAASVAPVGTILDGELLSAPHTYWVFDLLAWADEDLQNQPYVERHGKLTKQKKLFANKKIALVPSAKTETEKRKLYRALQKQKAEGIVFKCCDAPYTSGRPASAGPQLKHKFVKTAEVIITENVGNAYQMALIGDAGKPQEVGKMYSGTTSELRKTLDTMLSEKETPVAEVRYLYATKDSILFQPVFVRLRKDKSVGDCVLSQLEYTGRAELIESQKLSTGV